ncbi:MAG: aminotransferase class IV [Coxiellaceae bacterium]|nr:aminotransferase class IV [Coxiellaceae bacterium]
MSIIYLNGQFVEQEEAKVSVMDRGFLFGDGVYEVVPVYDGHMVGLQQHLDRLKHSLSMIHMNPPLSDEQWINIFEDLLEKNNATTGVQSIYLQVTRGPEETRRHVLPQTYTPTVLAFLTTPKTHSRADLDKGFSAITLDDSRRRDCNIKAITLLPNILLYEEARRAGAAEAILIRNGEALEGTSSNLFIVINNELITPPLNNHILGGVTRELIINLAKQHNIPCEEKSITQAMLEQANEIWMTGSSKEIYPIIKLNEKPVGEGKVGQLWNKMMDYYEAHKNAVRKV